MSQSLRQAAQSQYFHPETSADDVVSEAVRQIEQSLCTSLRLENGEAGNKKFAPGIEWIENFVTQPHAELGRKGAVCPFAQASHDSKSLYFSSLDAEHLTFGEFIQVMLCLPALYQRTLHGKSLAREQFSLAVFIEGISRDKYVKFVDMVHSIAKPVYMDAGLMLGEFHPDSQVPGVHSAGFRPMRCEVPVFVMRAMSAHDRLFIDRPGTAAMFRLHELECYLKWLGSKIPAAETMRITGRIADLKREVHCAELPHASA